MIYQWATFSMWVFFAITFITGVLHPWVQPEQRAANFQTLGLVAINALAVWAIAVLNLLSEIAGVVR